MNNSSGDDGPGSVASCSPACYITLAVFGGVLLVVLVFLLLGALLKCCQEPEKVSASSNEEGDAEAGNATQGDAPRRKVACFQWLRLKLCRKKSQLEERNDKRTEESVSEKERAFRWGKACSKIKMGNRLDDIGSRLQKYWVLGKLEDNGVIQFIAKRSSKCPVKLENKESQVLKELFTSIKHPGLLNIHDFSSNDEFVSVVVDFVDKGSLRDRIFQAQPTDDWSEKYTYKKKLQVFTTEEIIACGRDVLMAVLHLYKMGFPVIGQIHCGNIFIQDDRFILGGYENTLLGYRTRMFAELSREGLLQWMDVIMFGYVVYEMATGQPQDKIFPRDHKFDDIENKKIKEILLYIFNKKRRKQQKPLKEIAKKFFFPKGKKTKNEIKAAIPEEGERLLKIVREYSGGSSEPYDSNKVFDIDEVMEDLEISYSKIEVIKQMGHRVGKVYAKAVNKELEMEGLLTCVLVPSACPIRVKKHFKAVKEILTMKHENIVDIKDVKVVSVKEDLVLVVFQEFSRGSLKDDIYGCSPELSWEEKYSKTGKSMKKPRVVKIGRQILQAMNYLSQMDGSPDPLSLGIVHSGNIFVDGEECKLGSVENVLLGHKPRVNKLLEKHRANLDVIMFGHVLHEMCTGNKLDTDIPKDYSHFKEDVAAILKFIFEEDVDIQQILNHKYFNPDVATSVIAEVELKSSEGKLSKDGIKLLRQVRNGKPKNQKENKVVQSVANKTASLVNSFRSLPLVPTK